MQQLPIKRWGTIVREVLLAADLHEKSLGNCDSNGLFYSSCDYGFYVLDMGETVRVYTDYPSDINRVRVMHECVSLLACADIDSVFVDDTPMQGGYVEVRKLYDDSSETDRRLRALMGWT